MIQIRPVSDLRNKYTDIETTVKSGAPVFLTKNGYGTMVVLSLEQYSELTDRKLASEAEERMMDKSDMLAAETTERLTGDEVFGTLRSNLLNLKEDKDVLA